MNGQGKSDERVVPRKPSNKGPANPGSAEGVEERRSTKGNPERQNSTWTQSQQELRHALQRIRQVAEGDRKVRFTALWHHVYDVARLRQAYFRLKRRAAPGVDKVTWQEYREGLEGNLLDLSDRLKRGAYRAKPVRRVGIPKADGRQRLIGIPALEDKIVQGATAEVLSAVYETDFLGFSYGFRPGRSPHDALNALAVGLDGKQVNWVLDADIRGFFDTIDHGWLMKFVEHRIADRRVHRHIKKWLNAGVLEDGEWRQMEEGTPQGGNVSPLLANLYLHYVFDLWAHNRRQRMRGDVVIVRYADDFVVGFQNRAEAEQFLKELKERLQEFNLQLHPEKTRLLEFGRYAAENRMRSGAGKPETFDFLGFTHICAKSRRGRYQVHRRTIKKRMRAKLAALKVELRKRLHDPIPEVGKWLKMVLAGHFRYYGVPTNYASLGTVRYLVTRLWLRILRRRSQRNKTTWPRMIRLADHYLPRPHICHPWPSPALLVRTRGRSPVG